MAKKKKAKAKMRTIKKKAKKATKSMKVEGTISMGKYTLTKT